MSIFITGDTHGNIDINKLSSANFTEGKNLTKNDYLIILGDFGLIWSNPMSNEEKYWIDWLENKPWTTLFVDGNHENFNILNNLPVSDFMGGKVHRISKSIIHLMRGEIYNINKLSILAIGGACSYDKQFRTENKSWWKEEEITDRDIENAKLNLVRYGNKVDIVVSHCLPTSFLPRFFSYMKGDKSTNKLDEILYYTDCNKWFSGHYHADLNGNIHGVDCYVLYDEIINLE